MNGRDDGFVCVDMSLGLVIAKRERKRVELIHKNGSDIFNCTITNNSNNLSENSGDTVLAMQN